MKDKTKKGPNFFGPGSHPKVLIAVTLPPWDATAN